MSLSLLDKVCQCKIRRDKEGYTQNPKGPAFLFVCPKCLKPSRTASIRICEDCDNEYFEDRADPFNPYSCRGCDPDG